jgi:hypothetical protein
VQADKVDEFVITTVALILTFADLYFIVCELA